jgi:hypothetical protein
MPPTEPTPARRLATVLLEQPVGEWIAGQRDLGLSWRDVADTLAVVTHGQVVITHETARMWSAQ